MEAHNQNNVDQDSPKLRTAGMIGAATPSLEAACTKKLQRPNLRADLA